jgi:hypothetical protein
MVTITLKDCWFVSDFFIISKLLIHVKCLNITLIYKRQQTLHKYIEKSLAKIFSWRKNPFVFLCQTHNLIIRGMYGVCMNQSYQ